MLFLFQYTKLFCFLASGVDVQVASLTTVKVAPEHPAAAPPPPPLGPASPPPVDAPDAGSASLSKGVSVAVVAGAAGACAGVLILAVSASDLLVTCMRCNACVDTHLR